VENIKDISAREFKDLVELKQDVQIIDVRVNPEQELAFKCSMHIPLNRLNDNIDKISRDKRVVFVCDNGVNSFFAIQVLQNYHKFTNLWNLKGGVSKLIDNNI